MESNIKRVDAFLKSVLEANPSYSFGDPTIMYNHSRTVRDFALQIAKSVECDQDLLEPMALFHDIGKAFVADEQTLREKHAELGYEVTKEFLPQLELSREQRDKLVAFLKGNFDFIEAEIVKDADIIAFYVDSILQKALKDWGDKNDLPNELQRKADKIRKLSLPASTNIAQPLYEKYIQDWNLKR